MTAAKTLALSLLALLSLFFMTANAEVTRDRLGAVTVAQTTDIPTCSHFVDAAAEPGGDGSVTSPMKTIAAAVEAAESGAVICVAAGTYAEEIRPGEKSFTLAGGFQSGSGFKVRDSAKYVSLATGSGDGSFLHISDPGPKGDQLTAIDGFEITGYSQAIVRQHWEPQRLDITNNFIHGNTCTDQSLWGAGFSVNNVSGAVRGNVFQNNSCGRGGAGAINDETNQNEVVIESNLFDGNSGTEPSSAHGGALHIGAKRLTIRGNLFTNNSVTQWGGGLYVGAYTQGNQLVTATLAWNVYRANRAGDSGGGFFCDEGATCFAEHEVYESNCGGNVLVDGGAEGSGPTVAKFDHITVVGARSPDCKGPGIGFWVDTWDAYAPDAYTITNALFWDNEPGRDLRATCGNRCAQLKVNVDASMLDAKPGEGIRIKYSGNILKPVDPQFVDAKASDYRLRPGSPALGKGTRGTALGALGEDRGAPAATPALEHATASDPGELEEEAIEKAPATANTPATSTAASEQSDVPAVSVSTREAKESFEAAKELGTPDAFIAFLESYPTGFYAGLARAYLKKLGGDALNMAAEAQPLAAKTGATVAGGYGTSAKDAWESGLDAAGVGKPAIARGAKYMGFPERFNRYYTDPSWTPSKTIYVSPEGGGNGASRDAPMAVAEAMAGVTPGTKIHFTRGAYQGCFELRREQSGTYDEPILLYGERNEDTSLGVKIACCTSKRHTCFNFEDASYVAIDGFELVGGKYGVRAIGAGYDASKHSRGIAVVNCNGHDQSRDPFFSGQADWAVWEGNLGYGAKKEDGHGIYISNGSDWNIVRFNETHSNLSSDFQINADPISTCKDEGIAFDDPLCDAYAGEGEGGRGASDYFLVESNYFHHGSAVGPNFTSVRRSIVRNNIFGPQVRHNVSFWQETDNPKLGSSDNKVLHNLFITNGKHGVQFVANSTRNEFANNVLVGVTIDGGSIASNPSALLMEVDNTVGENVYRNNMYVSGRLEGREPDATELREEEFVAEWFENFPAALNHEPNDFTPAADAPFLTKGKLSPAAPLDRNGKKRAGQVDLGPIEID